MGILFFLIDTPSGGWWLCEEQGSSLTSVIIIMICIQSSNAHRISGGSRWVVGFMIHLLWVLGS